MSAAHWLVPPPPALMGMRAAPGVPAAGHALDPRACPACGTARPVTDVPARAPKPPRVRRAVPQPAPAYAPKLVAQVLDAVAPGAADAIDDHRDRVQSVGAHAPAAAVADVDEAPALPEAPAPVATVLELPVLERPKGPVTFPMRLRAALAEVPPFGADFTVRRQLLVAGADLALSRGSFEASFDVHELVVRAWQLYPETFAMRGYPQHPDSNRVLAKLSGPEGMTGVINWMCRVKENTVALTRVGVRAVEDLLMGRTSGKTSAPRGAARVGGV